MTVAELEIYWQNVRGHLAHDTHCAYHHTEVCDCGMVADKRAFVEAMNRFIKERGNETH